jgi:hypothetical protein
MLSTLIAGGLSRETDQMVSWMQMGFNRTEVTKQFVASATGAEHQRWFRETTSHAPTNKQKNCVRHAVQMRLD